MQIAIIGNYGATNIGDDAILAAILKSHSEYNFTVFSADHHKTNNQFGIKSAPLFPLGFRSFLKNGFRHSIKALREVDAVILGGGGLMQDNYLYACLLWAWQIFWVRLLRKPLFIYATGVGPLQTWLGRWLTRWIYNYAQVITVRDAYSCDLLRQIGVNEQCHDPAQHKKIYTNSDPVFLFKASNFVKKRTKNLFIISLRPFLQHNTNIINIFTRFLKKLKSKHNAEFIFICMQKIKESDHQIINPLIEKVGGEIYHPKHFSDLIQIMQRAEFAIGMRYHFLIAAFVANIPMIPISYSPKVSALFQDTPLEPLLIELHDLNLKILEKKFDYLQKHTKKNKNNILKCTQELTKKTQKNIDLFNEFLKTIDQN